MNNKYLKSPIAVLINYLRKLISFVVLMLFCSTGALAADEPFKVNWLAVSDKEELSRTWQGSLVYLPEKLGGQWGRLVNDGRLEKAVSQIDQSEKIPLILFMHYCEGLGHHWEDMKRLSKLGFIVIGPNSFARKHRPIGCYEDKGKFNRYFDIAVAMRKAELDFAVQKLSSFSWIDTNNMFLFGSGLGGLAVAHYAGNEFAGHLIEGWGCRGPNPIFDGIWAPPEVRVFTTVSRNAPFLGNNKGFSVDCETFTAERKDSVSIVLDRPAQQVSWYPASIKPMIRFLMRDMGVDIDTVSQDKPIILKKTPDEIHLVEKWSDTAVYETSKIHCATFNKNRRLIQEPHDGVYKFVCE